MAPDEAASHSVMMTTLPSLTSPEPVVAAAARSTESSPDEPATGHLRSSTDPGSTTRLREKLASKPRSRISSRAGSSPVPARLAPFSPQAGLGPPKIPPLAGRALTPSPAGAAKGGLSASASDSKLGGSSKWGLVRRSTRGRSGLALEKMLDLSLPKLPETVDLSGGEGRRLLRDTLVKNLKRVSTVFRQLDVDESGELDRAEMIKLVHDICAEHNYRFTHFDEFFDEFDRDGSGFVSLVEFTKNLRSGALHQAKLKQAASAEEQEPEQDPDAGKSAWDIMGDSFYDILFAVRSTAT